MVLTRTNSSNQWLPIKTQPYRYIPEEIVVNILPNLPPNSLARFRCVSKDWRRLISHIKTHKLLVMSERPDHGIKKLPEEFIYTFSTVDHKKVVKQIGTYRQQPTQSFYVPTMPSHLPWLTTKSQPQSHHFVSRTPGDIQFMGSCNGLVLVREDSDLILWNPTTSRRKKVLNHPRLGGTNCVAASGLCFDSITKSYKAIFSLSYDCSCCWPGIIAVGSCKSKSWKQISFPYKIESAHSGPVFNTHLHWYVTTGNFCSHFIIYFDSLSDKFLNFPMPEPVGPVGDTVLGLGVLDGCLCMTRVGEPVVDLSVFKGTGQVWVMKEYGVKESWTILFKLKDVNIYMRIEPYFYCPKKSEVLIKTHEFYGHSGYDIVAYDFDTDTTVKVTTLNRRGDAIAF